ncbi:MAG TPA: single-stranded DNA-binding protein [Candidatus Scatomorpha merdigallinarum]|nr:single-stranded DNA-binding protein [Candidatus Scatomorpha merdigallinarum]
MLNHIVLMGRLTRDVELRYTQSQIPVASMRIAVDRDFGRGEDRQTDFIDVVAWRHTAEFVNKYFHKGSMMVVSGRLQMRDWTDKDGNKRTSAEVVADNVYFGDSNRRDGSDRQDNGYTNYAPGGNYGGSGGGNGGGNGGSYGGGDGYHDENQDAKIRARNEFYAKSGYTASKFGPATMYTKQSPNEPSFSELDGDDGELPF